MFSRQRARRDDARSVDERPTRCDPERDVAVRRTAAREDGRVAGFELGLHLRLLVGAGIDVPVRIDESRHRGHALGVDGPAARGGWRAGAPRKRSCPARTTIDPRSITVPLAPMMRALVIVRSCAESGADRPQRQAGQDRGVSCHQRVSLHLHSPGRGYHDVRVRAIRGVKVQGCDRNATTCLHGLPPGNESRVVIVTLPHALPRLAPGECRISAVSRADLFSVKRI